MKTYYFPRWYKIFVYCICLFGLVLGTLFLWLAKDVIFLMLALLFLLATVVQSLPIILTKGDLVPYCYITPQGFQIHRSRMIYWPEIEKVVFQKALFNENGWRGAYLILRSKGKKIKFCNWNEPRYKLFSGQFLISQLDDMKQEFEKYVPVEIK